MPRRGAGLDADIMDPLFKIAALSPPLSQQDSSDESDERTSFLSITKKQRKYGSTTSSSKMNETSPMRYQHQPVSYVTHQVQPGDTLIGIALRYQTTMEYIKRINKMWTNDTLFLRESLLVPSTETYSNSTAKLSMEDEVNGTCIPTLEASCSEMLPESLSAITLQPRLSLAKNGSSGSSGSIGSPNSQPVTDPETSLQDYLGNIDSQIEEAKSRAQQLQKTSDVMKGHSEINNHSSWSRSHSQASASSRLRVSLSDLGGEFNAATNSAEHLPDATVINSGAKKANKSLFNHKERARDEIFEL